MREWVRATRHLKCAPGSLPDHSLARRLADSPHCRSCPPRSDVAPTIEALGEASALASSHVPFRTEANAMRRADARVGPAYVPVR